MTNSSQKEIKKTIQTNDTGSNMVIKGNYYNAASRIARPIITSGQWGTATTTTSQLTSPTPKQIKNNTVTPAPTK